jgi:hypothetical protein
VGKFFNIINSINSITIDQNTRKIGEEDETLLTRGPILQTSEPLLEHQSLAIAQRQLQLTRLALCA